MSFKIVSDSGSNIFHLGDFPFQNVPLHILVGDRSFVDDEQLNVHDMYDALASYKGKTSTACPSPNDWVQAFGDADYVYCVTITSGLSGSYNSAHTAKQMYEETHPGRKVYLIDSRSTGPEMVLLIEKVRDLILEGKDPDTIYEEVLTYHKSIHLYYALASVDNLARNGRINPIVAKGIGLLGIRIIGTTTEEGTLHPTDKARGDKKALQKLIGCMKTAGYKGGRVLVTHSDNLPAAEEMKNRIIEAFGSFNGYIHEDTALCSYYAERGSVLIAFETI